MGSDKFELLARAGYGARGIVFILIAGLALFSGLGGGSTDSKSALDTILNQPFGQIWLVLVGLGLAGFVFWRLAQSIGNADNQKPDAKGYIIRAALFGSAVTYAGLALYAVSHALGYSAGQGSGGGEASLAAWAMSQPFGRYLAGAIGLGFVVGGAVTAFKGVTRRFEKYLNVGQSHALTLVCVYGLVSRGVVFAIVGVFFCYAAFTVNPDQAGSMSDALTWVRGLPMGGVLYLIVAIGLAAFGVYNFVEARYRQVQTPDLNSIRAELPKVRG